MKHQVVEGLCQSSFYMTICTICQFIIWPFKIQTNNSEIFIKMNSELSLDNLRYFEQLEERVSGINKQLKQMNEFAKDRQRKYQTCLKAYEKYVAKQNQVMKNNVRHSQNRNKFFLEEVKKAWKNGISNRQIVLRSLARTNIIKRDADEWIAKMEDEAMGPYQNSLHHQNNDISQSQLIQKYNQIVRQYNAR